MQSQAQHINQTHYLLKDYTLEMTKEEAIAKIKECEDNVKFIKKHYRNWRRTGGYIQKIGINEGMIYSIRHSFAQKGIEL
jgi:uncharacterized protein (DUF927 family)